MATTSIALMTQPLSKLPITFAETESAKGGLFGVGTIPTGPEAVSLELSTAVTQFSLLLNEASESSSSALAAPAPVDSSDVLMPQTFQTDAYDLVTLDGKELPFLGNFLPQAISEEDFLDLSSLNMASPSSGPTILDSESAQMPVTTVSDNSASSVAAASEIEIALLTANPSLLVEDKLGEVTGAPEPTNKMTNKSDSLGAALSKLAAEVEKRIAEGEAGAESADDSIDLLKSPSNQAKQSATVPLQLFPEQTLESSKQDSLKETRIAARIAENINSLREMDRTLGTTMANSSLAAPGSLEAISLNSGKAINSVDSFVNVLLSIDTSVSSSTGIAPALDQWKAEQASRAALTETADSPSKNSFMKLNVPMGQTGWGENLGRQLSTLMARNLDSAQIQLDPPELGPLQVKIQVHNDQVSLHFTTSHGVVKEALEGSSARLQEMFQDEGMELANLDVSDQSASQQDSNGSSKQELSSTLANVDPNSGAESEMGDGKLTLSSQWQQDDGKIDYFI